MNQLQKELEFFKAHQAEWQKMHPGKFVLIKGNELIGVFDNDKTAVAEGIRRFGTESFLVRGVYGKDETLRIPSFMSSLPTLCL